MNPPDKHSRPRGWGTRAQHFLIAVVLASGWGSIVQTQFNIASLESIGATLTMTERLQMTLRDLIGFTPIYAIIVLTGLLCAFPIAALIRRLLPGADHWLFALAGMTGIATAIRIVDIATPAPTLIAATRGTPGWLLMALGGAIAGAWFAHRR